MPPRCPPSKTISSILRLRRPHYSHNYATITPAAPLSQITSSHLPPHPLYPPTQPPSFKPPEFRKSQLLRQYASLLHSTPLILLFQHNNLTASEWTSIRRELSKALSKTSKTLSTTSPNINPEIGNGINIKIIQTGIFAAALRVVEYYRPGERGEEEGLRHVLGETAHKAAVNRKTSHPLSPLLSGPLALLTFPDVSPQHLATALSILAPEKGSFPAPTRKANPGWHDPLVQSGLQKLLLLGARVEGEVMDGVGVRWVGGIEGGLDGLRAQVVHLLSQAGGANVANVLEGAGRSLYFAVEGRRGMLEEEEKGPDVKAEEAKVEEKVEA